MPRTYISADARCRQIERLVREHPGITTSEIALTVSIAYSSCAAYMVRLARERRVDVAVDDPGRPRHALQRFYPPDPARGKAAA